MAEKQTQNLVDAAISLKPQLTLMDAALEGYTEPEFHQAFDNRVKEAVHEAIGTVGFAQSPESEQAVYWLKDFTGNMPR